MADTSTWVHITDRHVLEEIGQRVEGTRLDTNVTQQRLAEESGVSKSTVERLEKGESVAMQSFIRVLRVLGLLDSLMSALPERDLRPTDLAAGVKERRKRASSGTPPPEPWTWGDE